jgi:hypothetical protein
VTSQASGLFIEGHFFGETKFYMNVVENLFAKNK